MRLTNMQREEALTLRAEDPKRWSFRILAKRYHVSDTTIYRLFHPELAEQRRSPLGSKHVAQHVYHDRLKAQARKLLREIPLDTRDRTAFIAGDPLPGRSALDQRVKRQSAGMRMSG